MENQGYVTIDGMPVELHGERNLLEVIRRVGIKLPTFCYSSDLSIYGACRMCMVEDERGSLMASCSTIPKDGMVIRTNTERLRKYRKNILELLLANHCRDCTTCLNNGKCKLQDLAMRYNITSIRFPNTAPEPIPDDSSLCISRDAAKCVLCGDCVRMCNEIQNVGAIDFAFRGSKAYISTAFGIPLAESPCVGCGQCAAVCPTGALIVKNDTRKLWEALDDPNVKVVAQIAPAVRVALGKELKMGEGENGMGKLVTALRRMGFDEVYDTSTGADFTVLEEAGEFLNKLETDTSGMPLFTSCFPAWVNYCEKNHPDLLPYVSTCKSPMEMLAAIIKEQHKNNRKKCFHVAIMPCTAKKYECARDEFIRDGEPDVDVVITTQEIIQMIKESGIMFAELASESVDMPLNTATGAGMIFGVTGGVTEAVLRRVSTDKTSTSLQAIAYRGVRGFDGVKEAVVPYGDRKIKIAVVSGLGNAEKLIQAIKAGEHYDFVEVMACPNGCIAGAGQPFSFQKDKEKRGEGLYNADIVASIKRSEENPLIIPTYNGVLKGRVHELLHVHYSKGDVAHD